MTVAQRTAAHGGDFGHKGTFDGALAAETGKKEVLIHPSDRSRRWWPEFLDNRCGALSAKSTYKLWALEMLYRTQRDAGSVVIHDTAMFHSSHRPHPY